METKIRLLLADDHALVLDGLEALLLQEPSFEIAAKAGNGKEAIQKLAEHSIDIALLDIDMPEMNGFEVTFYIIANQLSTKILLLSMHAEPSLVNKALEIGADGYVLKTAELEELVFALKQVKRGKKYFDANLFMHKTSVGGVLYTQNGVTALSGLTTREKEILKLLSNGLNNNEIGEQLFISPKTVDTHRTNLMRKLNVHNIAALIRIAIKAGL
jgi:DNA-binding NarL/FixJ family response regulator